MLSEEHCWRTKDEQKIKQWFLRLYFKVKRFLEDRNVDMDWGPSDTTSFPKAP
jgi:hypothetical protein